MGPPRLVLPFLTLTLTQNYEKPNSICKTNKDSFGLKREAKKHLSFPFYPNPKSKSLKELYLIVKYACQILMQVYQKAFTPQCALTLFNLQLIDFVKLISETLNWTLFPKLKYSVRLFSSKKL